MKARHTVGFRNTGGLEVCMQEFLLSVFPLGEQAQYARLTCIALQSESPLPMPSATLTRPGLLDLLAQTSFAAEATRLLHQLDSGEAVQLALGEQDRDICESLSSLSLAGAASHTVGNRTSSTYLN